MRFACWITQARIHTHTHTHTLVIFNIYCFSAAKMTTRTRLNVMLHAHCLSCYYVNINSSERRASHVLWAVSQLSQATYPAHLQWPLQHSKHCHWTVDFILWQNYVWSAAKISPRNSRPGDAQHHTLQHPAENWLRAVTRHTTWVLATSRNRFRIWMTWRIRSVC